MNIKDAQLQYHITMSCVFDGRRLRETSFQGQEVFSSYQPVILTPKLSYIFYIARKNLSTHCKFHVSFRLSNARYFRSL